MPGVIRSEGLGSARGFSFADLEAQGQRLIEQARAEAGRLLEVARREAEELRQQQFRAGYQQGLEEGRAAGFAQIRAEAQQQASAEARQQIADLVNALVDALRQFDQSKRSLIAAAETGLIELAIAIARRVCRNALGLSEKIAQANAKALLELVQHAHDVELHFHPADYERLSELGAALFDQVGQSEHVRIVADETVDRGGCLLRTPDGQIDARLETQLDRIAATLLSGQVSTPAPQAVPPDPAVGEANE